PCVVGRGGLSHLKKEGDGATPVGRWQLLKVAYRADRGLPSRSGLPLRVIRSSDAWCDAVGDRNYNRQVSLPYPASHETMCRADGLYDVVVMLSHNQRPRVQARGSAIFLHLISSGATPTAGCVALSRRNMVIVLALCDRKTRLVVQPAGPRPACRKLPSRSARR
ncbi:MAG: L,D-transpeptidase family protein, partial [Aestuariivirga sp.]